MRKPRVRINRCGKAVRLFEEVLRSLLFLAFGKMIDECREKGKRKKGKNKNKGIRVSGYQDVGIREAGNSIYYLPR